MSNLKNLQEVKDRVRRNLDTLVEAKQLAKNELEYLRSKREQIKAEISIAYKSLPEKRREMLNVRREIVNMCRETETNIKQWTMYKTISTMNRVKIEEKYGPHVMNELRVK